jgi:hypothetical protein
MAFFLGVGPKYALSLPVALACAAWVWSAQGASLIVVRVNPPFPTHHGASTIPVEIGFAGVHTGDTFLPFHGDGCAGDCARLRDAGDAAHAALLGAVALLILALFVRRFGSPLGSVFSRDPPAYGSLFLSNADAGRLWLASALLFAGIALAVGATLFFGLVCAAAARSIEAKVAAMFPFSKFIPGAGGDAHYHVPRPGRHALTLAVGVWLAVDAGMKVLRELVGARHAHNENQEAFLRAGGFDGV